MKTKTINFKDVLLFIIAIAIFSSCQKTITYPDIEDSFDADNGYFVTNEGAFFGGNGSVTYVSEDGDVFQDIFENANGFKLGNTVQSMSIINNKAYIVENGSGSVTVARADSMTYIASITAISPRYITQVSTDKAYITDWGIDGVQVVDLNTNTTSDLGSGGGIPGLIIAILMKKLKNSMKIKLYEKSHHKCVFLKDVSEKLELNTEIIQKDIFKLRDIETGTIMSRAFKPMPIILDLVQKNFRKYKNIILFMGKSGRKILNETLKIWDLDYEEKKSLTNKDSFLLNIKNMEKKI